VTAFLVDEMFAPTGAVLLRDSYGHDAVHVADIGLRAAEDADVAAVARRRAGRSSPRTSRITPASATWSLCLS
jgi:hypothetical protein